MADKTMFAPLAGAAANGRGAGKGDWVALQPVPDDAPPAPAEHPTRGTPSASWTYRDRAGALLGHVCRFDRSGGKEILPLTFCEHSGSLARAWRWKGWPVLRPLYGLDRLAQRPDAPVVVVEGEKAADAAARLLPDHVVVTSPNGALAGDKADWGPLAHRRATIWPDADEPGRTYAAAVARALTAVSAKVTVIVPPEGVAAGWDAADALAASWDTTKARALVAAASPAEAMHATQAAPHRAPADGASSGDGSQGGGRKERRRADGEGSQRNALLELLGEVELWHTSTDRDPYATVPINGHVEHWGVRSRDFRLWLIGRFYRETGGAPGGQATEDALRVVEAKAINDGPEYVAFRRVGEAAGRVYLDLADAAWRAVEIDVTGWRVLARPPVKFLRSPGMAALPAPEGGELIESLRGFVNVETDADFQLLVAFLVGALRPKGPYPILILNGEQGSAKSTTARVVRALLDPNASPSRAVPRDERDLFIAAVNSWCLSLDNLSGVPEWLSDALCRISTGGGFATRELHSDRSEVLLDAQRPIILNGIPDLAARPDLGDRALGVTLPAIGDDARRPEAEFWSAFDAARPGILGALCGAVTCALQRRPAVRLERLPRMADFALWVTAAEPGLGWGDGSFVETYSVNRGSAVQVAIENDPVAQSVQQLAEERDFEGRATELLAVLDARVSEKVRASRAWPHTASRLGGHLLRVAPALRSIGIEVRHGRIGDHRAWFIRGRRPA